MKATIGLEIHLALSTKEKLFSSTINDFSVSQLSLFDCATPGVLPVISREPVEMAVAFGMAVGAEVKLHSKFERKHYFYPDLPLGYQITQQHEPIIMGGSVEVNGKRIMIEHAHLECDAAKSIHSGEHTYIDLSRCASALLEIVSMPCMHSAKEASSYAKSIHEAAMFLGICDGKLEEGSFRVDASISVSDKENLGTRVEVKNISSFKFLEAAIDYEIQRQTQLIKSGGSVVMETRLFQEKDSTTHSMRKKETVDEYRYLIDPDIPELILTPQFLEDVQKSYPTDFYLMKEQLEKILATFSITSIDLKSHKSMWILFYETPEMQTEKIAKIIHYWLPVAKILTAEQLSLLSSFSSEQIKNILEQYTGGDIRALLPISISLEEVRDIVVKVLFQYNEQVEKLKGGEVKMMQFLIGKCMSQLKGKTTAVEVKKMIEECI